MPSYQVGVFGEARGNPGLAGLGVVLHDGAGRRIRRLSEFLGTSTPVQAEYRAILKGLTVLAELPATGGTLYTTHEAPFRQLTGKSSAHAPEIVDLYIQARACLSRLPSFELRLVVSTELEMAERLAAVAIDSRGRRQAID